MDDQLFNKILDNNGDYALHKLTEKEILMLKLSDLDIEQDRLIPHDEVMKNASNWIKTIAI